MAGQKSQHGMRSLLLILSCLQASLYRLTSMITLSHLHLFKHTYSVEGTIARIW